MRGDVITNASPSSESNHCTVCGIVAHLQVSYENSKVSHCLLCSQQINIRMNETLFFTKWKRFAIVSLQTIRASLQHNHTYSILTIIMKILIISHFIADTKTMTATI